MFEFDARRFAGVAGASGEHQESVRRMAALATLGKRFAGAETEKDVFETLARFTPHVLGVDRCSVALLNERDPTFEVHALEGKGTMMPMGAKMLLPGTAVGEAADTRVMVSTFDHALDAFGDWRHLSAMGLNQFLVSPMIGSGAVIGTLNVGAKPPGVLTQVDALFTEAVAALAGAHVQLRRLG